jgi:2-methylisocitrate lyase-like PEP mutase family enzyme
VLNARTDAALRMGDAPRANVVEEVVRRGRAFLEAGAPVVFVPRLFDRDEIRTVVDALGPQKLSVMSVPGVSLPTRELQDLGVARVSTGPFTQRVALTALQEAAAELLAGGTLPEGIRALN